MENIVLNEYIDNLLPSVEGEDEKLITAAKMRSVLKEVYSKSVTDAKLVARPGSAFPAVIKRSSLETAEINIPLNDLKFLITEINQEECTITINKNLLLPVGSTWYMYIKGVTPLNPDNFIVIDANLTPCIYYWEQAGDEAVYENIISHFIPGTEVGFCSPHVAWTPFNYDPVLYPAGMCNIFPYYLSFFNGEFISLVAFNDGEVACGYGKMTSTDFKVWSEITKIIPEGPFPSWMKDSTDTMAVSQGVNNIFDGVHFIPFLQESNDWEGAYFAGIMKTSDFSSFTYSDRFTCSSPFVPIIDEGNFVSWHTASYAFFNGKHLIVADIAGYGTRLLYLMEWGGSTEDMSLKYIQVLGGNKISKSWNSVNTMCPAMFISNNQLFMLAQGYEIEGDYDDWDNGNVSNIGGLYIFDVFSGTFIEYHSNPWIINPKFEYGVDLFTHHQGYNVPFEKDGIVYALMNMNHAQNTYGIFPAKLNLTDISVVQDWINKNNSIR